MEVRQNPPSSFLVRVLVPVTKANIALRIESPAVPVWTLHVRLCKRLLSLGTVQIQGLSQYASECAAGVLMSAMQIRFSPGGARREDHRAGRERDLGRLPGLGHGTPPPLPLRDLVLHSAGALLFTSSLLVQAVIQGAHRYGELPDAPPRVFPS